MDMDKECLNCPHQDNCQRMYEQLGKSNAPSVALNVVLVFLIPIIIFIAVLAVFKNYFELEKHPVKAVIACVIAVFITFIYILLARWIVRRRSEKAKRRACIKEK